MGVSVFRAVWISSRNLTYEYVACYFYVADLLSSRLDSAPRGWDTARN